MHMYEQHNAMSLVLLSHISQDTKISFSNSMRENNVECSFADRVTIIKWRKIECTGMHPVQATQ